MSTHLIRRHQTWYVRVQIPKKLWAAAGGKRAYVKSLGTRDISEANSRKHQYIAEYKRHIKALQQARHDPLREVRLRALEWRDAIEKAKGETIHLGDEDYEESYDSFLMSEALDEARDVLRAKGEKRRAWPEEIDDSLKNYPADIQHPAEDHPILRLMPTG